MRFWFPIVLLAICACSSSDEEDERGLLVRAHEAERNRISFDGSQFFEAIRSGDQGRLDTLVRDNTDALSVRDNAGIGLLEAAIIADEEEMITTLTYANAPVDSNTLIAAIRRGDASLVRFAARNCENPDKPGREGSLPLGEAVRWGDPDIVSLLLRHEADPLLFDVDGKTPLDYARLAENTGRFPDREYNYTTISRLLERAGGR